MTAHASLTELRTIPEIIRFHSAHQPEAAALIHADGDVLSYSALWQEIETLAGELCASIPARAARARRIGIALPNGLDISVTLLAASLCGAAVPFNPKQTLGEFTSQFDTTGIDALIVRDDDGSAAVAAARAASLPVLRLSRQRKVTSNHGANRSAPLREPDDIALILMTSGSTGKPKIVPLSHRNVCRSAFDIVQSLDLTSADRCLVMWEQFHIGGLVDLLLAPLAAGSSAIPAGGFDAAGFFRLQAAHRATWFQGVPTSLGALLQQANRDGIRDPLPDLRFLRSVAAALSPTVLAELVAQFRVPVVRTLGMTEAGPLITTTDLSLRDKHPQSVGRTAGPDIRILDPLGKALTPGHIGEVAIRGENVFAGYLDNPDANAQSFRGDWFLTGDLGRMDAEGYLFLTGRAKDMINRGGEKISPGEVDEALMAHPGIHEAACFAVPHGTLGEDIVCAVSGREDAQIDANDIRVFLSDRLARHKIPTRVQIMSELPRTSVGKIDRLALRDAAQNLIAGQDADAQPQTPMEALVAEIWKRELSLSALSVDQDFASVDGDSLSAVRILVALEAALGAAVPHDVIENFATVRQIASGLERHGLSPKVLPEPSRYHTPQTEQLLNEDQVFGGDLDEARLLISTATGAADLSLKLDYLLAHLAPGEVARIVEDLRGCRPGHALGSTGFLSAKRMQWALAGRMQDVRGHLKDHPDALRWQKETLCPNVLLFGDPDVPSARKSLIAGFAGNRRRLLLPTYRVLMDLNPETTDLLLLMDPSKQCFFGGIDGMGRDFSALARAVAQLSAARGYRRMAGLGISGGTFAVLQAGLVEGFDAVTVVSPAGFARHPDWAARLEPVAAQHDPEILSIRIVYGRSQSQKANADSIRSYLPQAEYDHYPQAKKNVIKDAQERGMLKDLLRDWLD